MSRLEILQEMAKTSDFAKMLLEKRTVKKNLIVEPVVKAVFTTERTDEQIIGDSTVTFNEFWEAANRIEGIE